MGEGCVRGRRTHHNASEVRFAEQAQKGRGRIFSRQLSQLNCFNIH